MASRGYSRGVAPALLDVGAEPERADLADGADGVADGRNGWT